MRVRKTKALKELLLFLRFDYSEVEANLWKNQKMLFAHN
jgi:hypothetical protein